MANPEKDQFKARGPEAQKSSEGSSLSTKQANEAIKQVEKAISKECQKKVDDLFGKVSIEDSPIKARDAEGRPTEFRFENGNSRDVSYFPNGKVREVKLGLPNGVKECAGADFERFVSNDNGKTYQAIYRDGRKYSEDAVDVRVNDTGTVYYRQTSEKIFGPHVDAFSEKLMSEVEHSKLPTGEERETFIGSDGNRMDTLRGLDGKATHTVYFPNSTFTYNDDPRGPSFKIKDEFAKGSVAFRRVGYEEYEVTVNNPNGTTSHHNEKITDKQFEEITSSTDLKLNWQAAKAKGQPYNLEKGPELPGTLRAKLKEFGITWRINEQAGPP